MEKKEEKIAEFCVDSSVILDLFYLYKNNKQGINGTLNRNEKKGSVSYVPKMLYLLQSGQIRLYVPYNVLAELYCLDKIEFEELKFFLENNNFVNMHSATQRHEVLGPMRATLAWRYCKPMSSELIQILQSRLGDKGVNLNLHRPIFELNSQGKPSKYARNVAESAVAGIPFVTVNDQVYKKCYRNEMIKFANNGLKGVRKKAAPISPEYMFKILASSGKPQITSIYAEALKKSGHNLKSFDFKQMIEEQEMSM